MSHDRYQLERGTALVLVIFVMVVGAAFASSLILANVSESEHAKFTGEFNRQTYLVQGGLSFARNEMLQKIASFKDAEGTGSVILDNPSQDHNLNNPMQVTVNYEVRDTNNNFDETDTDGVYSRHEVYEIRAWLDDPIGGDQISYYDTKAAYLQTDVERTPIFQFAVFYDERFEFFPGVVMTLAGRVHSNDDFYIGSKKGLDLDTSYVRSAQSMFRHRFDDPSDSGETDPRVNVFGTWRNWDASTDSRSPTWVDDALAIFEGIVQDQAHGVKELDSPSVGTIGWNDGDYYYEEARTAGNDGLVILDSGDPSEDDDGYTDGFKVLDNGNNVTQDFIDEGIIQRETMFDGREEKVINLLEIDFSKLRGAGYDYWPDSGLIYAARTDATDVDPHGVRATNAEDLGPGRPDSYAPMLVTGNPAYIWGNWNTAGTKNPSVVMTDALNLLSNAWDDSKTDGSLPAASATTYNMAFITGVVETPFEGGPYSGGLENLPRFHEKWTGVDCDINGSFICLWESEIAQAEWLYGDDNYKAPRRNWKFDDIFLGANSKYFPDAVSARSSVLLYQ